ncbi:hypothetical protein OF83DRAFT_1166630 [Amylostereum chailletii]|nr:hypothetical protein OF83DRAFT_1166630 [Amylostereum chailletii]
MGFLYFAWDSVTPYVILDNEDRIIIVLLGRPREDEAVPFKDRYTTAMARLAVKLDDGRGRVEHVLRGGRRGDFGTISVGTSYGGGQKAPCPLSVKGVKAKLADELLNDKDAQRVAGFGSAGLSSYFPKVHKHMVNALEELYRRIPSLKKNFHNSDYPACTFNLGPDTVCFLHNDCANFPGIPCVVTALDNFDADYGGDLVLWELMLRIRFPAALSIALPSAGCGHGNTDIRPGEKRFSLTQYCAGGIMRWAGRGFRPSSSLWAAQLSRFSKFKDLRRDREELVQWEAERRAHRSGA